MKSFRNDNLQILTGRSTLHTPLLPPLPERIRRLVSAAYAAHGGAEHMSLADWRDIEQQLNRKIK